MEKAKNENSHSALNVVREIIWILPLESLHLLEKEGSEQLKVFLASAPVQELLQSRFGKETLAVAPSAKKVDASCPLTNSFDVCLRSASQEGSLSLSSLFMEGGATDISGALTKAAEAGSYELIELLQEQATPDMFSMAAAHAAWKGHLDLTISLYNSGGREESILPSIFLMALEGGQVEVMNWVKQQAPHLNVAYKSLIGRNIEKVLVFLGLKEGCSVQDEYDYLYGACSFGEAPDIDYVLQTFPRVLQSPTALARAFAGALANNNRAGYTKLEAHLTPHSFTWFTGTRNSAQRELHDQFLLSAVTGGNMDYVKKYLTPQSDLHTALCIAVAKGHLDMVHMLKKHLTSQPASNIVAYAAYSGSLPMIEEFTGKEASVEEKVDMAYGAAAGGNWDFLHVYLLALRSQLHAKAYLRVLSQVVAEAIHHSQLSLLNNLYNHLKDELNDLPLLHVFEDALEAQTTLVRLAPQPVHLAMQTRLHEILA